MKIFGIVGWSGSGKTELLVKLLPELRRRGFRVSTMKHTHHNFDIDKPGKDSYRHRKAGAEEVLIASGGRWALVRELRDEPEPDMDTLIEQMTPVDLLLIEGFKRNRHPKLEVSRPATGKSLIATDDDTIVAVASDARIGGLSVPLLDLDDVGAVADFIIRYTGAVPGAAPSVGRMQMGAAE
ncbi:molybdopterin-guanine dinucleotide biosynthesis protein B [Magnetovibrio sp.]|uniref:molybdopterin-guanine dinucleotide biosynthesis protein B n=1 Tax=Magnetovibrio sp. TaxID=2024836 RepID=UPI002F95B931